MGLEVETTENTVMIINVQAVNDGKSVFHENEYHSVDVQ